MFDDFDSNDFTSKRNKREAAVLPVSSPREALPVLSRSKRQWQFGVTSKDGKSTAIVDRSARQAGDSWLGGWLGGDSDDDTSTPISDDEDYLQGSGSGDGEEGKIIPSSNHVKSLGR